MKAQNQKKKKSPKTLLLCFTSIQTGVVRKPKCNHRIGCNALKLNERLFLPNYIALAHLTMIEIAGSKAI